MDGVELGVSISALAAETAIDHAFFALIRTRRQISDEWMATGSRTVAFIDRALVAVIGTRGACGLGNAAGSRTVASINRTLVSITGAIGSRGLGIGATETFAITCIRVIAGGVG